MRILHVKGDKTTAFATALVVAAQVSVVLAVVSVELVLDKVAVVDNAQDVQVAPGPDPVEERWKLFLQAWIGTAPRFSTFKFAEKYKLLLTVKLEDVGDCKNINTPSVDFDDCRSDCGRQGEVPQSTNANYLAQGCLVHTQ